jgi:two-component system response regulator MprA
VSGFKPFAFEELIARIHAVLRRRNSLKDNVIRVGELEIDTERRQVRRGDRLVDLTTREFDLLTLLAQNADKPLSREVILQRIWGYDFGGETDPVKVYINYLRRKLNAGGEMDMLHTLRGFGYVLKERTSE